VLWWMTFCAYCCYEAITTPHCRKTPYAPLAPYARVSVLWRILFCFVPSCTLCLQDSWTFPSQTASPARLVLYVLFFTLFLFRLVWLSFCSYVFYAAAHITGACPYVTSLPSTYFYERRVRPQRCLCACVDVCLDDVGVDVDERERNGLNVVTA